MSYTKSIVVEVSDRDREDFFDNLPMMKVIDLPVSDEMVARFNAVRLVNAVLPVHESVTKVLSTVVQDDGTYAVRLNVLD